MTKGQQKIELSAQPREILGQKVKSLRNSGYIPAVLYGKGMESTPIQITSKDFEKTFKQAGESTLVYLNVSDKTYPTIIHDVARDALKDNFLHADFYKVRLDEKIKTNVPVVFEGESPAVKSSVGVFIRNVNELEVEALPQNLPHEIIIDISGMAEVGDQILVKDIRLGADVKLIADENEILAVIQAALTDEQLEAALKGEEVAPDEVKIVGEEERAAKEAEKAAEAEAEGEKPAPTEEK